MQNDGETFHSGSLNKRGGKKTASFNLEKNSSNNSSSTISNIVEITIDINDDAAAVHSIEFTREEDIDENSTSTLGETSTRSSRTKQITQKLKRLTQFSKRSQRGESAASSALGLLNFISNTDSAAGWKEVEGRFRIITMHTQGLLSRAHFGICIGMIPMPEDKKFEGFEPKHKSQGFAMQLFDALSRERNISGGLITVTQMREFWEQISDESFDGRLQTLFDMFDKDGDGRITQEEVKEVISLSASANVLSDIKERADEYAALIMEELDPNNVGYIMIYDLETILLKGPTHLDRGDESEALGLLISQKLKPKPDSSPLRRWYEKSKYFLLDNWQRVWVMALWIGVMAGLFAYKYIQYKNKAAFDVMGHCVCMAKGAAETLKLNMALILLPVCRNTITWLRNKTRLGAAVPLADNLEFHKVIAIAIAIGVGIHGISHLACDFPRLLHATEEAYAPMEQYFGEQPTSYWWFVKGVEGVTGIIMVVLMTIAFTLASPWFRGNIVHLPKPFNKITGFKAFWYSHHLFVIVYTLLIVHGIKLYLTKDWYKKTTWMYLAVPIVLYACERLLRAFRSSIEPVEILKVNIHDGNLLALRVSKPKGFEYRSGQYMFVKCTAVSTFEWHPFSITSAPGDDYLSVHIKGLGDWTKELIKKFSKHPLNEKRVLPGADDLQGQNTQKKPLKVSIDGPYGAPAQDYRDYDVVLLVGLGIGATPMISIIKDIVNNINADGDDLSPPNGATLGTQKGGRKNFRTRKAYFYWVTREQESFDWFKEIMDKVAEMDHQETVDMHIHCSSVYEEGDARSAIITMLQSINHAKKGVDVVSGTRVKSHFGRPNWPNVYKSISINHPNTKIGVFYCGLPVLAKELAHQASDFSKKTPFKFDFHKEIF